MYSYVLVLASLLPGTLVVADENSELQKSIISALISATKDADDYVRFAAFSALKDQPRSDAIVGVFRRGLEDDNINVRSLALSRIVDYEGPTDEVLERLISAIKEPKLASVAKRLLIEIGEPAVPRLIELLESDKTNVKLMAVDILGRLHLGKHRREAVTNLTAILKDKNREIRIAAIDALKRIAASQFPDSDSKYVKYAKGYIARYDTNKDGVLTKNEWSKMGRDYGAADQDRDGRITPEELARQFRNR